MTWIVIAILVLVIGCGAGLYFWKKSQINKIFLDEAKAREKELLTAAEQKLAERLKEN
jgi:uncharacterized protein HemX